MSRKDVLIAPALEAVLILVVALAGWVSRQPLIFASLGPTAFELIETPERPSARPYNILMGHGIAVAAGFAALWLTGAWWAPVVSAHQMPFVRVWAAALAAMLTVLGTLLARATQPAALSTTLIVSLGMMQQGMDAVLIMVAVMLMTLLGEPVRRWRERDRRQRGASEKIQQQPR